MDSEDCDHDCTVPICGDGFVNPAFHEQCEPAVAGTDGAGCDHDCTLPACGDGIVHGAAEELCDPAVAGQEGCCDPATCAPIGGQCPEV